MDTFVCCFDIELELEVVDIVRCCEVRIDLELQKGVHLDIDSDKDLKDIDYGYNLLFSIIWKTFHLKYVYTTYIHMFDCMHPSR